MKLSIFISLLVLTRVSSQQSDNEKFASVITKYIAENSLAYNLVESNLGGYGNGYGNLDANFDCIKILAGFDSKSIELKETGLKNQTAGSKSKWPLKMDASLIMRPLITKTSNTKEWSRWDSNR